MKQSEATIGMLVSLKESPDIIWGKVLDKATSGCLLVESFAQGTRHFINAGKFQQFPILIEPDEGSYHAWAPSFKGLHTCGDTLDEAKANVEDAARAYLQCMLKHGEVKFNGSRRTYESPQGKDLNGKEEK